MKLAILGTRGIPAQHDGFETFAERLALHLVSNGWAVTVYCPDFGAPALHESQWRGIRLLHLPVHRDDAVGTIVFDWKSTLHDEAVHPNLQSAKELGFFHLGRPRYPSPPQPSP